MAHFKCIARVLHPFLLQPSIKSPTNSSLIGPRKWFRVFLYMNNIKLGNIRLLNTKMFSKMIHYYIFFWINNSSFKIVIPTINLYKYHIYIYIFINILAIVRTLIINSSSVNIVNKIVILHACQHFQVSTPRPHFSVF